MFSAPLGLEFGVEPTLGIKNAYFACPSTTTRLNISVLWRKFMALLAVSLGPSNSRDGWIFTQEGMRKVIFAKYLLCRFTRRKASYYRRPGNTYFSRPLRCSLRSTFVFYDNVVSFIVGLLSGRGPGAINRVVGAVIIFPLYRTIAGNLSHVGKKVREFLPSLTNRYASSAIVFVGVMPWISAACEDTSPNSIRLSIAKFMTHEGKSLVLKARGV